MRCTSVLSRRKTPATTRPIKYAGRTASLLAAVARPPRKNKMKKMNFTSGSLTRVAPKRVMIELRPLRHEPQSYQRDDDEDQQRKIVGCKQRAQCKHGSEIGDETASQNHLAHRGVTETALDHHCINHRDRRRRKRDAGNLRLVQRPPKKVLRKEPHNAEWNRERQHSNQQARPPVGLE